MFGRRKRNPEDFSEELRAHLALEAQQLKKEGLSAGEAEMAARRRLGNIVQSEERYRRQYSGLHAGSRGDVAIATGRESQPALPAGRYCRLLHTWGAPGTLFHLLLFAVSVFTRPHPGIR